MKVIKPQKLGLLPRSFEYGKDTFLVLTMAAFFPLDQPDVLLPEVALWKFAAEELGGQTPLDEGLPKQRGEVLVHAQAFPPGGTPQVACQVRVRVGSIDKTLRVVGNRHWDRSGVPSPPEPFTQMPLTYAQAFGGQGYAPNPLGKGFVQGKLPPGALHPLPNVEAPNQLIRSPKDKPAPAGLLPLDTSWPQRASKAGTYDSRWLKTRFPGFAEDLDESYFNAAPEDQWLSGYFQGGERFFLEHLHPSQPRIEGTLPRLTARAFVTLKTPQGESLQELSTRLDTVWLFPHAQRGVLLFRALAKVAEDDAADVLHCVTAFEAQGAPRPAQHYKDVLARRLDKKQGYLFALQDSELLPEQPAGAPGDLDTVPPEFTVGGQVLRDAMRRGAQRERDRARETVRAAGVDPDTVLPATLPPEERAPTLEELPAVVGQIEAQIEEQKASAERQRVEAEQHARRICAEHGIHYEKVMQDAKEKAGGPPRFSAREEFAKLQQLAADVRGQGQPMPELEAMLAAPAFLQRMEHGEAQLREIYQRFAHHMDPAAAMDAPSSAQVRARVEACHRAGQPLAREDLTGADLSGMELPGVNFQGALMERVNLKGANLSGANLEGAVLARAELSGARLTGANLKGANLGRAQLLGTRFDGGAELSGANLSEADLSGAKLRGAKLTGADLSGARMKGADFREVSAAGITFMRTDLSQAAFTGAQLAGCIFLECTVTGADFSGATLTSGMFLTAKGDGANFRQAKLGNLRLVQGCSFAKSDFQEAELSEANLRGTRLEESNFSGATLDRADLSECELRGARFYRSVARESRWVRANLQAAHCVSINLMNAILQKADISQADFTGANLFRADFAKVRGKAASMRQALLTDVRITQERT
ncbi:DUF2169 domain-containing protein [Hyalangium rubrum]|uniref:DUF2169 domain-containing protein n=1 Tax=Hyalangium rubrum TaxID=3103134 RepID=A0ABU5H1J4_9BACT|nr:DUF2169 domain-containing protein [Hyalangium sp. s54d21]MDY7227176.1 DUF2169 domain-containing protein [Hyalangium sp. s54d21]